MNLKAIGNKLHVSRQAISTWEIGRHLPDLILVNQLANIYDRSVDELINDDSKAKLGKSQIRLLTHFGG